jgi:hypothetical protein
LHLSCNYSNLKQQQQISIKAFFMLIIYLISISPIMLFHDHSSAVVSYEQATNCEKAIFYGQAKADSSHSSHIHASEIKCSLCDNHTASTHLFSFSLIELFKQHSYKSYFTATSSYTYTGTLALSSRGPPTLL